MRKTLMCSAYVHSQRREPIVLKYYLLASHKRGKKYGVMIRTCYRDDWQSAYCVCPGLSRSGVLKLIRRLKRCCVTSTTLNEVLEDLLSEKIKETVDFPVGRCYNQRNSAER